MAMATIAPWLMAGWRARSRGGSREPASAAARAHPAPSLYGNAVLVAAVSAGFYLLMQLEIVLHFHWRHAALTDNLRELTWLVFSQNENLLVAAGWGALWLLAARRAAARKLFVAVFVLVLLYLVINQVGYHAFLDHLQVERGEDRKLSLLRLADSAAVLIGPQFVFNLVLAALLSLLLARRLLPAQVPVLPPWLRALRKQHQYLLLPAAAFVGFGITTQSPVYNYAHHPLPRLAQSLLSTPAGLAGIPYDPSLDIDSLAYGMPPPPTADDAAIEAWGRSAGAGQRPNIVYLILESVGARNLLPNGAPDPDVTPTLARHWKHTVAFPVLYNTFPGSTRSHLPIHTGGYTYTWGGGLAEARFDYRGPTLPGVLRDHGYRTGLFSAMYTDTEDFDTVYEPLPFDARLIPEHEPKAWQRAHHLNAWGVDERVALERAHAWLDGLHGDAPWFLLFLNGNTHHPYSVPANYPAPFAGRTDLERHKNSLHFADHLIARIIERLAARGELENTLIVVSGDHGQAFGEHHPTNFLHRSHLYEENIRNFLLVLDFTLKRGPLVSNKRGMIGDIMPTLLGRAGVAAPPVRGQNLAAPGYVPRIHYFHKTTPPEQWGLVDGRWKFIAHRQGMGPDQLFDLEADPFEQYNLAALHSERLEHYRRLVAQWYIRTDRDFAARLHDAADYVEALATLGEATREGPFVLRVGPVPEGDGPFRPGSRFTADTRLTAWTSGNPFVQEQRLVYTWIAPDGRLYPQVLRHQAGLSTHHAPAPADMALTPGRWQVRVADSAGRALLSTTFEVEGTRPQMP